MWIFPSLSGGVWWWSAIGVWSLISLAIAVHKDRSRKLRERGREKGNDET